ncbi:MAG TPA: DUF6600 domain-containing protein, partial [Candidatus Eremiobacteraceae bacterium]|nr:DUF6600 domain-containing protein [Candidatus Eremiobacteraceae bacterium]
MSGLTARKAIWCGIFLSFLTLGVGFSASAARADDQSQPGVARISIVQGNVDVKRGDSGDTVAAAVNAPVMVGDYISTDGAARAEVQFDDANFLRIGYGTQLRLTKLDQNDNSLQLAQGTVELRVFAMDGANPSIETPSVTVTPSEPGQYVVSVTSDGNTQVTVRSGSASVADDQGTQTVMPGNTMIATGDPSNASFQDVSVIADVSFDGWTDQLDAQVAQADAPGYVNSGVVGANDLNDYGQWVDVPTYGEVWQPTEDSGWAPYTDGRWVWEPYYGYTWVSYEPWGWAPYHYGNWFYASDYGWCWYPGSVYERPVWRPAMVAFFGYGSGDFDISVGFGYGDIGWVPVAPFEPFYPWWGGNSVTVVNVTNIYNITNVYSNFGRGGYVVVHARD